MSEMNGSQHLVDGKYAITDLVSLEHLKGIFEKFTKATGFPIGFLDHPEMNILISTGWHDICTKFHRSSPITFENCRKSNAHLLNDLTEPGQLIMEKCGNGLVDCATPIIIKGKHIASLATGQLLLEEPDLEFFRRNAEQFGFDEDAYMAALDDIPVFSEEKVRNVTALLGSLAVTISELGYTNIEIMEKAANLEKEIAERMRAEDALRESEQKYRALVETTGTGYVILDMSGRVIDANPEYVRLSGHERLDDILGRPVIEWTAQYDIARNAEEVKKCVSQGIVRHLEVDYVDKKGVPVPIEINATLTPVSDEFQIVTLCRDITSRKNIEKRLKISLCEKDTLLSELYHRTKNNMQVICSMLALRSLNAKDENLKTSFKEMETRIHAMALVHQKLYTLQNLSSINLKDYAFELSDLLMKSYAAAAGRVSIVCDVENISVLIDIAIPCGLILNELISNSLKYAFPGDGRGEIIIRIFKADNETLQLGVSDNGVGVRQDFDFRKDAGVGIKTVFAIGETQLLGKVKFESVKGLSCVVTINDTLYRARI